VGEERVMDRAVEVDGAVLKYIEGVLRRLDCYLDSSDRPINVIMQGSDGEPRVNPALVNALLYAREALGVMEGEPLVRWKEPPSDDRPE
jgi:hypothetical protein